MSGKSPRTQKGSARKRKADPRAEQTRNVLGGAIVALIQEMPFDSITVQAVLDRAGVSRSTFYAHFKDKNDLFMSDVEDFFTMMAGALTKRGEISDRVAPVQELFSHVAESQKFLAALTEAGKIHDIFELGTGIFARGIDERLARAARARGLGPQHRVAMAHALSGAMFSLLSWWLNQKTRLSAAQIDDSFHRMVWAGLGDATISPPEDPVR